MTLQRLAIERATSSVPAHPVTTKTLLPLTAVSQIEGILFDMDGVLIDSEPVHEISLLELSALLGRRFETHAELQVFKGLPELTAANLLLAQFPESTLRASEVIALRLEKVRQNFQLVKMIAGAKSFLQRCKSAGYRLGLTTSADPSIQQLAFTTFELAGLFDAVITGRDVKIGKPDPEPYLLTAAKLGLAANKCMVVEDAVAGVCSGKAAGCLVVGVTTSFSEAALSEAGADFVASSFAELEAAFFHA